MKKNFCLLILITTCFFYSCSNPDILTGHNVYKNDFESIFGWTENSQLVKENAHSGNYCLKITPENPYSLTFRKKLGDFGLKSIDKIKVSAWVKFSGLNSNAKLVITIDSAESAPPFFWSGVAVEDFITDADKWFNVSAEITLPNVNNNDYKLLVYLWNIGKEPVFLDDFSFQLIEGKK